MKRRGRPVLGAIAGLLFGLFVGLDLVILGVVPVDSVVVTILVGLGLVGGLMLGLTAPFGGRTVASSTPGPAPVPDPSPEPEPEPDPNPEREPDPDPDPDSEPSSP